MEREPFFLSREQIDAIHQEQIDKFTGRHGLRDEGALESAIAAPQNVYWYGEGDLFEMAAAYAYHIAENQAYVDGNKRTGMQAALDFLEINGVDTSGLPEEEGEAAMLAVANHKLDQAGLARFFRRALGS